MIWEEHKSISKLIIILSFFLTISVTREIDERLEFLEEMQSLGRNYVRKYQSNIKAEIAEKAHQLEMLQLEESEKIAAAEEAVASSEDLFRS